MELTLEDLVGTWELCAWCLVPDIRRDEHPEQFAQLDSLGWRRARAPLPTWGWQPVSGSVLSVAENGEVTERLGDPSAPPRLPWRGADAEASEVLLPFRSVAWVKPTEGFAGLSWFDHEGREHTGVRHAEDGSTVEDAILLDDDGTLVRRQDRTVYDSEQAGTRIGVEAVLLRYRRTTAPHPSAQQRIPSVRAIDRWWAEYDARYTGSWDLVAIHEDPMILEYMDQKAYVQAHRTHMIPTMRELLDHPWMPIAQADPSFIGMRLRIDADGDLTEQAIDAAPRRFWDADAECGGSRQMPFDARLHRVRREPQFTLALSRRGGAPGRRGSMMGTAVDTIHVPDGHPERLVRIQSIEQRDEGILIRVHFLYEKADPDAPVSITPRTLSEEEIARAEDTAGASASEPSPVGTSSEAAAGATSTRDPERRSDDDLESGMLWLKPEHPGYTAVAELWAPTPVRYPSLDEGVDVTDRIPQDIRETNCAYWQERIDAVGEGVRGVRATISRIRWGTEAETPLGNGTTAHFHPDPPGRREGPVTSDRLAHYQVMTNPRPVGPGPVPSPFAEQNRTLPAWLEHELFARAEPTVDGHRCAALIAAYHVEHGLRVLAFHDEAAVAIHAGQNYRLEDPLDLQLIRQMEETA